MAEPVLYSFRRCPYAMRARMAIGASGQVVELREILLGNKPQAMLDVSPKGTVPVLVLDEHTTLDESLSVMRWALSQADPEDWLAGDDVETASLLATNDGPFKGWLDRYKYHVRQPEQTQAWYRAQAELILADWEARITRTGGGLLEHRMRLADVALFPFVRQFSGVEPQWWAEAPYPALREWLAHWVESARFLAVMRKYPVWSQQGAGESVCWAEAADSTAMPI